MLEGGEGREGGEVPQDRRDAHIVILYKNNETQCNNYRDMSFLSIIIIIIIIIINYNHNNNNNNTNNNVTLL